MELEELKIRKFLDTIFKQCKNEQDVDWVLSKFESVVIEYVRSKREELG